MKQNVEEQSVIVKIVNGPIRQRSFDESCIALTGRDVAWFVRDLLRNQDGEFDDIFEDKDSGKKRRTKKRMAVR